MSGSEPRTVLLGPPPKSRRIPLIREAFRFCRFKTKMKVYRLPHSVELPGPCYSGSKISNPAPPVLMFWVCGARVSRGPAIMFHNFASSRFKAFPAQS